MAVTCKDRWEKQPGESLRLSIDVSALLDANETVTGNPTITASPAGLTISSPSYSNTSPASVSFRCAGGLTKRDYRIQVDFPTSFSNTRSVDAILEVRDE